MELFISWSGQRGRQAAEDLKTLLEATFGGLISIWYSETSIPKGRRWADHLARALAQTRFGIVCVTRENRNSPWLLFEAGAIAATVDSNHLCPVLIDLRPAEMEGPLAQFQSTQLTKRDFEALVRTINSVLESPRTAAALTNAFAHAWQVFSKAETDRYFRQLNSLDDPAHLLLESIESRRRPMKLGPRTKKIRLE